MIRFNYLVSALKISALKISVSITRVGVSRRRTTDLRDRFLLSIILLLAMLPFQPIMTAQAAPRQQQTAQPWTLWDFMNQYSGSDKINRLHNAFAVGTWGCSGTMVSPHLYLTAAHCGGDTINVRFYHIDEDAPGPANQYQQLSQIYRGRVLPWQHFIHPTGYQDGDGRLFWLEDGNDGVPPGVKYGYIELSSASTAIDDAVYSFWTNPEAGLATTLLYNDGVVINKGAEIIGDPPVNFTDSNFGARPGASGSSLLGGRGQQVIGVTVGGNGSFRRTADTRYLLDVHDADSDGALDAIEYDLLLDRSLQNFNHWHFQTPLQRTQWGTLGIGGENDGAFAGGMGIIGGSVLGPIAYRATWNGLWMDPNNPLVNFYFENFEDGQLNIPGVSASAGSVLGPGSNTDSVDNDDGNLNDYSGNGGHSFFTTNGAAGITFTFDAGTLGRYPTRAGLVWTDGDGAVTFEAWDAVGNLLGRVGPIELGDGAFNGGTREDRFFAVHHQGGISKIKIRNSRGGMEIDHLQYGTGNLYTNNSAAPRDVLMHSNARFAPNATYRISALVYGTTANKAGYIKLRSTSSGQEEQLTFTPALNGWQRVVGRITLRNYEDYRLILGGVGDGSYYLSQLVFLREDGNAMLDFDTGTERRSWEYVHEAHPTAWGIDGAGDFSAVVVGPTVGIAGKPDWGLRNRHVALEANHRYEISFVAQHVSGALNQDLFMQIEDLSGLVQDRVSWRFGTNGERVARTAQVVTLHGRNGITFGAMGDTTYMVDNIRIVDLGPVSTLCRPKPTVIAGAAGLKGTKVEMAFDGDPKTAFVSSDKEWQYLQIDAGCLMQVNGLRRMMSHDGENIKGHRGSQGETVAYSIDGTHWVDFTGDKTTGWQSYVNYRTNAWHSVNYGWSETLLLKVPVYARHIRFRWDGNGDALNEVEVDWQLPDSNGQTLGLEDREPTEDQPQEETSELNQKLFLPTIYR